MVAGAGATRARPDPFRGRRSSVCAEIRDAFPTYPRSPRYPTLPRKKYISPYYDLVYGYPRVHSYYIHPISHMWRVEYDPIALIGIQHEAFISFILPPYGRTRDDRVTIRGRSLFVILRTGIYIHFWFSPWPAREFREEGPSPCDLHVCC